jgi:hypothetical protein
MATTALAYHFSCSCSNDVHTEHLSRGFFSHHLYKPLIFREDHAKGVHAEWGSTDYDIKALLFLPLSGSNPRRRGYHLWQTNISTRSALFLQVMRGHFVIY